MPTENQSTTYCRSRSDGRMHRFGEKKDCIRCNPVTKPAKTKEPVKQGVSSAK